ncbi:hypothetical protein [Vibrio gallicus]|uniref:hypothetical protein n=1 Tax=Vibrio gallicus TaxID=190897 RepID=UPI0021C4B3FF|nr:hypothetical protein [Vibrio gallicus]
MSTSQLLIEYRYKLVALIILLMLLVESTTLGYFPLFLLLFAWVTAYGVRLLYSIYCKRKNKSPSLGLLSITDEPILSQPVFYLALIVPLFWATIVFLISFRDVSVSFDAEGMQALYETSRFPFMILWSSIPLMAMVASIHRTKQTEKQISKVEKQIHMSEVKNNAELFLSHYEFYTKAITEVMEKVFEQAPNINLIHYSKKEAYMNIFRGASIRHGIAEISTDFFEQQLIQFEEAKHEYLALSSLLQSGGALSEHRVRLVRYSLHQILTRIGCNVEHTLFTSTEMCLEQAYREIMILISLLDMLAREFRHELEDERCDSYLSRLPMAQATSSKYV